MPRKAPPPIPSRLLRHQRAAVDRLRRELLGADGSLEHPYFRALRSGLRRARARLTGEGLLRRCARADVIYVGDFHADPACQHFAADFLEGLARMRPRVALGVEFVYTRQQDALDRRQQGSIDDATFRRRIHYREEWGYPWEGFRDLLERARRLGIPVHALDRPPRGGFDGLVRRDEHAARAIAKILEASPRRRLVVLFGESHLTRDHIPRRVARRLARGGRRITSATVFQDPDRIYWSLLRGGDALPAAAEIADGEYAVFHTTPLAKYEAYRQVLERWKGDVPGDDEVDLTPAVHHLIRVLLGWLGIRPERCRIRHRVGWDEDLEDAFPEVYSGPEAVALLKPILEEYGRSRAEIAEARGLLRDREAVYESRSNTLFLTRYLPGRAAGEGARFVRAALSGRLFHPAEEREGDPALRAYGAAYNEALAYLGARVVDPASDWLPSERTRAVRAVTGGVAPAPFLRTRRRWLERHGEAERSRRAVPPDELLAPLRRSQSLRRLIARDLGQRLGQVLFDRVRDGGLDSHRLRMLFSRPLPPARAPRVVLQLLRL